MKASDIVTELRGLNKELVAMINSPNPMQPADITEKTMKMSVLNSELGYKLAAYKRAQFEKEKEVRAKCKEDGIGITETKEIIRLESSEERLQYENLANIHSDNWKMISQAQSHAANIRTEQKVGT